MTAIQVDDGPERVTLINPSPPQHEGKTKRKEKPRKIEKSDGKVNLRKVEKSEEKLSLVARKIEKPMEKIMIPRKIEKSAAPKPSVPR